MSSDLFQPVPFTQLLTATIIAILFLQSGIDKVLDFGGNLSWLQGHFAKSPLRGQVKPMLAAITVAEVAAGAVSLVGALQIAFGGKTEIATYGAQAATACIVMLFLGQRMAKDYAGAATLVPYFLLCAGGTLLMTL